MTLTHHDSTTSHLLEERFFLLFGRRVDARLGFRITHTVAVFTYRTIHTILSLKTYIVHWYGNTVNHFAFKDSPIVQRSIWLWNIIQPLLLPTLIFRGKLICTIKPQCFHFRNTMYHHIFIQVYFDFVQTLKKYTSLTQLFARCVAS